MPWGGGGDSCTPKATLEDLADETKPHYSSASTTGGDEDRTSPVHEDTKLGLDAELPAPDDDDRDPFGSEPPCTPIGIDGEQRFKDEFELVRVTSPQIANPSCHRISLTITQLRCL